ncbi:hypothetical protein ACLF3G_28860 [Falsiroseomonas sp. HC035]|uniref:hypothetical protein n=1 Tax=Falsiroseomonas sp. HC035 TaxID=3390999 RepID=UPI003D319F40
MDTRKTASKPTPHKDDVAAHQTPDAGEGQPLEPEDEIAGPRGLRWSMALGLLFWLGLGVVMLLIVA